jgi:acetolactate synthase-1/3 small subunit
MSRCAVARRWPFSARGYNIESPHGCANRIRACPGTIQTSGSDDVIEQITKHLNRLIEVVKKLT